MHLTELRAHAAAHGPILTVDQPGMTVSWLSRATLRGDLVRVLPGVYAIAAVSATFPVRVRAVAHWNPDAVICGAAAARLTYWPDAPCTEIDVAARSARTAPGFRISRRSIPPELIIQRGENRVVSPALAAVQLMDTLGGAAIDHALRSRRMSLAQLWDAFDRIPHRSGNRRRRRLLLRSRTKPWSELERLAHDAFDRHGLKGWVANLEVRTRSGNTWYLDIAFRSIKLVVELDGWEHHSSRTAFEEDRYRQNDLVLDGWTVLRFTYRQVVDDPAFVIATIKATITRLLRAA